MVNLSLTYHKLTNFELVKLANYFLHLMFVHPVVMALSNIHKHSERLPNTPYACPHAVSHADSDAYSHAGPHAHQHTGLHAGLLGTSFETSFRTLGSFFNIKVENTFHSTLSGF